jgi:hypothetical protein
MIASNKNKLAIEVSKFIAENLMPMGDRCTSNSILISHLGFERITAYRKCQKLICTDAQIRESDAVENEMAREKITSYLKPPYPIHYPPNGYVSPLLSKLREDRERQGYTFEWYKNSGLEEWRYELSPFKREWSRIHKTTTLFEIYKPKVDEIINEARSAEISKFSTGALLSSEAEKPLFKINFLLQELLSPLLSNLSFVFSNRLSTGVHKLVFIRNYESSLQLRVILVLNEWYCDWRLYCCKQTLGSKFDGILGEWYSGETAHEIRLWNIIPHFDYRNYCSPDDLEVCVRAHVASLELEFEFLEAVIASASAMA